MDNTKLILTGAVSPPALLEHLGGACSRKAVVKPEPHEIHDLSQEKQKQAAKDFESVFLSRLLDEMKNTVGDWGFEKDGVSQQVQGIFWLYLAQDIADKGGFGLWKDIHGFLTGSDRPNAAPQSPGHVGDPSKGSQT
jgi:Rod binding domain-containing protein